MLFEGALPIRDLYGSRVAKYCYNILISNKIVAILLGGFRNFSYLCI